MIIGLFQKTVILSFLRIETVGGVRPRLIERSTTIPITKSQIPSETHFAQKRVSFLFDTHLLAGA